MSKPLTAGQEVEGYCTKCRLDLDHRIVAMEGDRIARVECLTCRTQHNYYKPKSAAAAPKARATRTRAAATTTRSAVTSARKTWEQAVSGRDPGDFTAYSMSGIFQEGQLVSHRKFGEGVVTEVQSDKVQVLFGEGTKMLVHARES